MGPGIIDESTAQRLLDYRARGGLLSSDELDALISYHCACAVRAERVAVAKASAWSTERPTSGTWWVALHPEARGFDYYGPIPAYFNEDKGEFWEDHLLGKRIPWALLNKALWLPRETPADPFKE